MGYIYILTSPSGKSYIGQTIRPIEKRLEEHQQTNSQCVAIGNAIKKHGWENFEKDWYECPDEDLNFDEDLLVREMGTLSPGGYNLREGGGANGKLSEETKQKIREANLGEKSYMFGIPKSEESKQKNRDAHLGEKNPNYGKPKSKETIQKMSEAKKGDKSHNSKRVYQYDIDGTFIDTFGSIGEAARHLKKKTKSNITKCASGKKGFNSAYGFKWSHVEIV
jgi:group I intron endonuclease